MNKLKQLYNWVYLRIGKSIINRLKESGNGVKILHSDTNDRLK